MTAVLAAHELPCKKYELQVFLDCPSKTCIITQRSPARELAVPGPPAPMLEFLQTDEAQVILWTLGGAALCVIGVYVVKRFRDRKGDNQPSASELLTNFREIHSRGGLSDEEFRTIKAQLAAQLEREINENDDKG
jgi:hypothetical protein